MSEGIDLTDPAAVQNRRREIFSQIYHIQKQHREAENAKRPKSRYGFNMNDASALDVSVHEMERWARDSRARRIQELVDERNSLPKREKEVILADLEQTQAEIKVVEEQLKAFDLTRYEEVAITDEELDELAIPLNKKRDLEFAIGSLEEELAAL
jgi:hypothetical protein